MSVVQDFYPVVNLLPTISVQQKNIKIKNFMNDSQKT